MEGLPVLALCSGSCAGNFPWCLQLGSSGYTGCLETSKTLTTSKISKTRENRSENEESAKRAEL
ncbi:hypothetical protein FOCC_FOCC010911 [Frankliniella occidentalis]|nr:hypothetical protein FOCC_FOCC010911 [Frankliniella occidentalis]